VSAHLNHYASPTTSQCGATHEGRGSGGLVEGYLGGATGGGYVEMDVGIIHTYCEKNRL
jgi:hypothetical protein